MPWGRRANGVIRTVVLRLEPGPEEEEKLRLVCELASKLWNELNYRRRRLFFEGKLTQQKLYETYKEFYYMYNRLLGSATTQAIIAKNDTAWRSFFRLLALKKKGRLPPHIAKASPPGYRKRSRRRRRLWLALRQDQYRVDTERGIVEIRRLGVAGVVRVRYRGLIHVRGRQRGAEIWYDHDRRRWYIAISYTVEEKLIHGRGWVRVPMKPRGSLEAGVDLGVDNLLAVYVENGEGFLVNGRPLKAESFYWQRRIARYKSVLDRADGAGSTSRRLRLMYRRWRARIRAYIDAAVRRAMEELYSRGVARIYVGYPRGIARRGDGNGKLNFERVHVWTYGLLLRRLKEVAWEYGIEVVEVDEAYTSQRCPLCGAVHPRARVHRGLYICPHRRLAMNADMAAAYNILAKGTKRTITPSPEALTHPHRLGVGVTPPRPGARGGAYPRPSNQ
ncbi:putative transposase [Pyrodictium delaneyi]|uniref:Putative transposase n=1 Tax=Pyrodictium delaneyi TaxID=1273541 RepID=A0A0P0N341_9CREN|nr:RNA-guided endonuclease TnpB family protein [Pyrodictium delaneyi]ALL00768.1 putative transposase [Pyrodictium delaneyi]